MNNPLKYTHPSGWLKYYNIDGDWRETSYTTWYGFDWEGPGRGSGGGWSTHTGWTSTTYTLFSNNSQQAGLNGYIGGETVPGDYLGSVTFLQPYSYNTFTMPDYSGAGNVVTPTGDMAAMGGGGSGGYTKPVNTKSNSSLRENYKDALGQNREFSISLEDWINRYSGKTFEELFYEEGKTKSSLPKGPSRRFVKDPFYEGVVIDMKHFLAALRYGEAMTDKNEDIQNRKGNIHSAYNPQDYYSNNLGLAFRSYLVEKYPLFGDQEITFIDIIYGTELVPSISYFFYNFLIRFNYEP